MNVVRISGPIRSARAAGRVTYFDVREDNGPACLEAETFEHQPLVMTRITVDVYSNGQIEASGQTIRLERTKVDDSKPSKK